MGDEVFNLLMRVARERADVRALILRLSSLDKPDRVAVITKLVSNMQGQGAPNELIEAVTHLADQEVADTVVEFLKGDA